MQEFADEDIAEKEKTVSQWEMLKNEQLKSLFSDYLFRIRHWMYGKSARYFGKDDTHLFKGYNLNKNAYPVLKSLKYLERYVRLYTTEIKDIFPFQLDQAIINGRLFFKMVDHYRKQREYIDNLLAFPNVNDPKSNVLNVTERARTIIQTLNNYPKAHRTGDKYIRLTFACLLLFYIDKFGDNDLSLAIEKFFIWAYSCRIQRYAVSIATIDIYVLKNNFFEDIRQANSPKEALSRQFGILKDSNNKNSSDKNTDTLVLLFKYLGYYE